MKGLVPVNGNGQEGIFNEHGFGEEAAWQAEAEEHWEGGEEQPGANFDLNESEVMWRKVKPKCWHAEADEIEAPTCGRVKV